MDLIDWDVATDADGAAITALAAVSREVRERQEWAMLQIDTDAGGPRIYAAEIIVHDQ